MVLLPFFYVYAQDTNNATQEQIIDDNMDWEQRFGIIRINK